MLKRKIAQLPLGDLNLLREWGPLNGAESRLAGEWGALNLAAVEPRAWWGLAYLVTFGSLVGFAAYTWLLRNAPTPIVATYA